MLPCYSNIFYLSSSTVDPRAKYNPHSAIKIVIDVNFLTLFKLFCCNKHFFVILLVFKRSEIRTKLSQKKLGEYFNTCYVFILLIIEIRDMKLRKCSLFFIFRN